MNDGSGTACSSRRDDGKLTNPRHQAKAVSEEGGARMDDSSSPEKAQRIRWRVWNSRLAVRRPRALSCPLVLGLALILGGITACLSAGPRMPKSSAQQDVGDCVSLGGPLPPGAVDQGNCGYKYLYARGDAIDLSVVPTQSPIIPQGGAEIGDVFIRAFAPPLAQAPMSGVLFVVKTRAQAIFNARTNIDVDPASVDYNGALLSIPLSGTYPRVVCVLTEEKLAKKMIFPRDMPASFNKVGAVWIN